MPWLRSRFSWMLAGSIGLVKLGQPQPIRLTPICW